MYNIPELPLKQDVETKAVLKQLVQSHRRLAELTITQLVSEIYRELL